MPKRAKLKPMKEFSRRTYLFCKDCSRMVLVAGKAQDGDFQDCPHPIGLHSRGGGFSPVVVHRDAQGNYRFPGHADAKVPKGYEKVELTSMAEVRKFENTMNSKERARMEQHSIAQELFYQDVNKRNREELRHAMKSMSPIGRAIAQAAIEANNTEAFPTSDPGFHIEVAHYNEKNLPYPS